MSTVKQVIVIRKDLKMRRGKEIAQGSHASMAFMSGAFTDDAWPDMTTAALTWLKTKFTKVCLRVDSEEALMDVYNRAKDAGLMVHLITDSGLTEFNGVPTRTCIAIGPDYSDNIDAVTGDLKLY